MVFKVIGTFRSALSRQIFEAVRIKERGIHALNSKWEYDMQNTQADCWGRLPSGWKRPSLYWEGWDSWEEYLITRRIEKDRNTRRDAKGDVSVTRPKKRNVIGEESTRPPKKKKFVLVGPDWGTNGKPDAQRAKLSDRRRKVGKGYFTRPNQWYGEGEQ